MSFASLNGSGFSRALILAGGREPETDFIKACYRSDDLVIAADKGAGPALKAKLPIHVLLGDFDSIASEDLRRASSQCLERLSFSRNKDFSDLEGALNVCQRLKIFQALILGGLGKRWDHSLFNIIAILQKAEEMGISACLKEKDCEIRQLKNQSCALSGRSGGILSLIALDEQITADIQGVKWPLVEQPVLRSSTRTLSNKITENEASVKVTQGRALLIITG